MLLYIFLIIACTCSLVSYIPGYHMLYSSQGLLFTKLFWKSFVRRVVLKVVLLPKPVLKVQFTGQGSVNAYNSHEVVLIVSPVVLYKKCVYIIWVYKQYKAQIPLRRPFQYFYAINKRLCQWNRPFRFRNRIEIMARLFMWSSVMRLWEVAALPKLIVVFS